MKQACIFVVPIAQSAMNIYAIALHAQSLSQHDNINLTLFLSYLA